jgi:hypothetical protein
MGNRSSPRSALSAVRRCNCRGGERRKRPGTKAINDSRSRDQDETPKHTAGNEGAIPGIPGQGCPNRLQANVVSTFKNNPVLRTGDLKPYQKPHHDARHGSRSAKPASALR